MSIESVMPSNHLILCCPLLLLPSIFPSIRVFSSESVLHIRWPKYWSFSFSISPSVLHIRWPKYWSFSFSISPSKEYVCINRQKKQLFTQLEKKEVLKFQHIYDTEKQSLNITSYIIFSNFKMPTHIYNHTVFMALPLHSGYQAVFTPHINSGNTHALFHTL